jgi:pimeloyl-ACP methyl ester carboxylesterase
VLRLALGIVLVQAVLNPIDAPAVVRVPVSASGDVDMTSIVGKLAAHAELSVELPKAAMRVPILGLAGALTRTHLKENLGPDISIAIRSQTLEITLPHSVLEGDQQAEFRRRVRDLAAQVQRDARRLTSYGMHARESYRPNDPHRPTVCLIHGINSSSGSFVHMVGPLEEAGFGLVVYDFPYNRDLDESVEILRHDWAAFRREQGETRAWAVVTHSMGGLLARAYVERESGYAGDVSDLCLIAPPNRGSAVAQTQVLLQFIQGLKSINARKTGALAQLSDGLGEAATDMMPESRFLKALNARPRREGVGYHILAGDAGFLSATARTQVETQYRLMARPGGLLGGLTRLAIPNLPEQLDELTDGRGDGCVTVASTKLDGVTDHEVLHANHVELIRGPLLYPDPGPVACMPWLLKRLGKPSP